MPEPILTKAITEASKWINNVTKPEQKVFWKYITRNFFWFQRMALSNSFDEAEEEAIYDLKKQYPQASKEQLLLTLKSWEVWIEYENMFWTLQKAALLIEESSTWDNFDKDKIKRLKDLSKEYSSDEMQDLIAWILAWEYNNPWSYSLNTMEIVKKLSKEDIELFSKFYGLVINDSFILSDIYSLRNKYFQELNSMWIWYMQSLYLIEIWLLSASNSEHNLDKNENYSFMFSNKTFQLESSKKTNLRSSQLTRAWKELWQLLTINYTKSLEELILDVFSSSGLKKI